MSVSTTLIKVKTTLSFAKSSRSVQLGVHEDDGEGPILPDNIALPVSLRNPLNLNEATSESLYCALSGLRGRPSALRHVFPATSPSEVLDPSAVTGTARLFFFFLRVTNFYF